MKREHPLTNAIIYHNFHKAATFSQPIASSNWFINQTYDINYTYDDSTSAPVTSTLTLSRIDTIRGPSIVYVIATDLPSVPGDKFETHSFTIPWVLTPGKDYFLTVTTFHSNGETSLGSSEIFTIAPAASMNGPVISSTPESPSSTLSETSSLVITYPVHNSTFVLGQAYDILYQFLILNPPSQINLELWDLNGKTNTIVNGLEPRQSPESLNIYEWSIPNSIKAGDYFVKIVGARGVDVGIFGISPQFSLIKSPSPEVQSRFYPNDLSTSLHFH